MTSASSNRPLPASVNSRNFAWPVVILAFVIAFIRLAGLVMDGSVNVIYGDQWGFLTPLFLDQGPLACFLQQHGPPRQGVGGVFQWALYGLSGWDTRWESWCGFLVLLLTAASAVALSARLRGRLAPVDALFPLMLLSPIHWETLLLSVNLSHSILPLGMVVLLAWTRLMRPSPSRALATGALGVLCLFTGFGFCAAVMLGGLALLQAIRPESTADRRDALGTLAALGIGFGLFFTDYTWSPAIPGWVFPVADWWNYGSFVSYMAATLVGMREKTPLALGSGGFLVGGAALALLVSTIRLRRHSSTPRSSIIQLLIGTGFVYMAMTAVGRLPAGIEAAFMWRYATLGSCMALGLFFFLTTPRPPHARSSAITGACAAALLAFLIWGGFSPERAASVTAQGKKRWAHAYLATRDIAEANRRSHFWVYPPEMDQTDFATRLNWLEKHNLSLFADSPAPPAISDSSEASSQPPAK